MMEKQEQPEQQEPYVAALIDTTLGDLYLTRDPARSIRMNRRTGEATDINSGMEYLPLTKAQLEDYERDGYTVKKQDGELMIKIGHMLLKPRRIEVIAE